MTDDLKLAGKAVNLDVWFNYEAGSYGYGPPNDFVKWNPLLNDRDAFRLMAALRFFVTYNHTMNCVDVSGNVYFQPDFEERQPQYFGPGKGMDVYTATRIAIVKAAATIGRNK